MRSPRAIAFLAITSISLFAAPALAGPRANGAPQRPATAAVPAPPPPAAPVTPKGAEVRLALSPAAAKALSEPQLRRLLELEVQDVANVVPGLAGPLGDHVALVWVDQPTPAKVVIEVRVGDRPLARREIAVLGLSGVAPRLVAIAISELVHAGVAPRPPPAQPEPKPRAPTQQELDRAARTQPALIVTPAGGVAFLPQVGGVLGGPSIGVGFRGLGLSETLFGRWLTGTTRDAGAARWLEIGLAAEYRLWLTPSWRLAFGGSAGLASVHLGDALGVDGILGESSTWSARAGGVLGVEARLASPIWLGLSFEPGALLRPVRFERAAGARGVVEGLWLGASLSLHFEWMLRPPPAAAAKVGAAAPARAAIASDR